MIEIWSMRELKQNEVGSSEKQHYQHQVRLPFRSGVGSMSSTKQFNAHAAT